MDLDALITSYRQWIGTNQKYIRVVYNTTVVKITLTPQALWNAVQESFTAGFTPQVSQMNNTESLDGFSAWYNQVYLPAQP